MDEGIKPLTTATLRAACAAIAILGLSACAASMAGTGPDQAEAAPPTAAMVCNAAAAQGHVGQKASEAMGAAVLRESGARTLRWGPPGAVWTRDFRQDRVNVSYDADMTVTEIICG
jgi:hypothetical protein